MQKRIVAYFEERGQAEKAAEDLRKMEFDNSGITIVDNDYILGWQYVNFEGLGWQYLNTLVEKFKGGIKEGKTLMIFQADEAWREKITEVLKSKGAQEVQIQEVEKR